MLPVIAVDLGAGSLRVARVDLDRIGDRNEPVEVVHRYAHSPVRSSDGSLRWDWPRLMTEVELGLELVLRAGSVASIGISAWGVDYGLIDTGGRLTSPPFAYRDNRTSGWQSTVGRFGERRLYETT